MKFPKVIDGWVEENLKRMGFKKTIVRDDARAFKKKAVRPVLFKMKPDIILRNAQLEEQEFDFKTIRRAMDIESILRQAKEKYVQLMWKNGYSIVGKNDKAVKYIKTRFSQIALVTGNPTDKLFREISEELITYHNVYIVKQREVLSSGGTPYINSFGKRVLPIAGLFVIPASHIHAETDFRDRFLIGWKVEQFKDFDDQFYKKEDIIHIHMNKAPGNFQGTPAFTPVLDDIRALRKMEENAEALVFQHAIPLFQYQIGSEDQPVEDQAEYDAIKGQIETMNPQGMFVVPHDHSITAVGQGSSPLDVEKYLKYFRTRVISGIGLSNIVFGESDSANRNTATVLDRGLQDGAKEFLANIKIFLNEILIKELLQEGKFDIMDPDNEVRLWTPEIDVDSKIAKETHTMGLYHGNCIDEDEMRDDLGREPIQPAGRKLMYWNLIEAPRVLIGSGDERFTPEGSFGHPSGLQIKKGIANKLQPRNQSGTKRNTQPAVNSTEEKPPIVASRAVAYTSNSARELYQLMISTYDSLMGNMIKEMSSAKEPFDPKDSVRKSMMSIYDDTYHIITGTFLQGFSENYDPKRADPDLTVVKPLVTGYREFLHRLGTDATILLKELQERKLLGDPTSKEETFINSIKGSDVITVFDSLRFRLSDMVSSVVKSAYQLGQEQGTASKSKNIPSGKPDSREPNEE